MADNQIKTRGTMFVFSGPSGGGKSSVIKRVLQEVKDIKISISVTTRDKREGEVEGEDYYFVSDKKLRYLGHSASTNLVHYETTTENVLTPTKTCE